MKVPHLNEFLRRAIPQDILGNILVDFSTASATYCNRARVSVERTDFERIRFKDPRGGDWNWGLKGASLEIVDIRKARVGGVTKLVVILGRPCNARGDLRV